MPTVLIVDDQQLLRAWLSRLLEYHSYKTIQAGNGQEAISQYRQHRPDVVLLDIGLPEKNGLDVLREIRQTDPNARVVMLTARSEKSTLIEAIKAGAKDFVIKPFRQERILLALERALD